MITRAELLEKLAQLRTDEVVVTTMSVVRAWGRISDHPLDFAAADTAMGHAADMCLGIALAQPARKVICLNGDGSMLMTLGTLVTIAQCQPHNLILFVIDNGTYEITGNQPVPGARTVDYVAMARAAGFPRAYRFTDAHEYEAGLPEILASDGPTLASVAVEPGAEGPISRGPHEDTGYLQISIAESARLVRAELTTVADQ